MGLIKLASDNEKNYVAGTAYGIGAKKSFDWGLTRTLGFHHGRHGTSRKNYKSIIKNNFFLDPSHGGSDFGSSVAEQSKRFVENSKNYVHIFGTKKGYINVPAEKMDFLGSEITLIPERHIRIGNEQKLTSKIMQGPLSRFHALLSGKASNEKSLGKALHVFVPHSLDGFEPDVDYNGIAIKTKNKLATGRNRYHAMINAVKQHGFQGLKNKTRFGLGAGLLGLSGYLAKKSFNEFSGKKRK